MNISVKKIIIVVLILLLILIALLLFVLSNNKNRSKNEILVDYYNTYNSQRASQGLTADDAKAKLVESNNEYYTVKGILDNFGTYINYLNPSVKDLDLIVSPDEEAEVLQEYKEKGIEAINNILANNYKKKYSINEDNIEQMLKPYAKLSYYIEDMYVVKDSEYINTYFVYGKYAENDFNYIVILDRYNNTYELYLSNYVSDGNYSRDNINTMKTLHVESIASNNNNKFTYKEVNKDSIAKEYFKSYMYLLEHDTQKAYDMLDETYREKRFNSIENFENYVKEIIIQDYQRQMVSYNSKQCDSCTEYVCQDNFGSNYIFKVNGVMKYTVMLDSYTVPVALYDDEYNSSSNEKKAQLSLNRFFECINNGDYAKAYNYLNSTYRANNFPTYASFEEYIKSNWYSINSFSYTNIVNSGDVYSVEGVVNDYKTMGGYNSESFSKVFVVKLGSDIRNFELSFAK